MKERSHLNVTFVTKLLSQFMMEISPWYVWLVRKYLQQRNLEFARKDKTYYSDSCRKEAIFICSQSLNLYMKKEELPTTLCSMCKKWKNSLFMTILQEVGIILQQISIILLFWVFWLQYRTLKKFVDTTMGLMKSAEISLIFLKVWWSQYGTQFFVTSIGQVCWREYVAPFFLQLILL